MAAAEDLVILDLGEGTSLSVHLYGATVISWKHKGDELLFVSSKSLFDNKKAIRGGIPVVFPNFGPWDLGPQHGFARISRWNVAQQPTKTPDGAVTAEFTLTDNDDTRKMWNHKFLLSYKLTLKEGSFDSSFTVKNTGNDAFSFTCLLHTYFQLPDVTKATVSGFKGLTYTDKVKDGSTAVESRDIITVSEFTDRVYENTPDKHVLTGCPGGKNITVFKNNFPDTVVWNPWKEKAAAMADFGDEDYPNMLCVEAGHVAKPKQLQAGETFVASQTMSL
jgi:glucose-6-phosphate 1-epimerase